MTSTVTAGQTASGWIVDNGGLLEVDSGGAISGAALGGRLDLPLGASATSTTMFGGGVAFVAGVEFDTTILAGGAAASDTIDGSSLRVLSGGAASVTTVRSGFELVQPGRRGARCRDCRLRRPGQPRASVACH